MDTNELGETPDVSDAVFVSEINAYLATITMRTRLGMIAISLWPAARNLVVALWYLMRYRDQARIQVFASCLIDFKKVLWKSMKRVTI